MWRLSYPQSCDYSWLLPNPTHPGLYHYITGINHLFKIWTGKSIPSDPGWIYRHSEDCYHYSFDLFEYERMPFSLRNITQTFQRFIDQVLRDLPFCYAYIGDIIIASSNPEEHQQHLISVFKRCKDFGVIINPRKCEFGDNHLTFLGHFVTAQGIELLPDIVETRQQFPQPNISCKMREFFGLINFYCHFIPHHVDIVRSLYTLLPITKTKQPLAWDDNTLKAFSDIKQAIADTSFHILHQMLQLITSWLTLPILQLVLCYSKWMAIPADL